MFGALDNQSVGANLVFALIRCARPTRRLAEQHETRIAGRIQQRIKLGGVLANRISRITNSLNQFGSWSLSHATPPESHGERIASLLAGLGEHKVRPYFRS